MALPIRRTPGAPDDDATSGGDGDRAALSATVWQRIDTNGFFAGFGIGAIAEFPTVSAVDPDPSVAESSMCAGVR